MHGATELIKLIAEIEQAEAEAYKEYMKGDQVAGEYLMNCATIIDTAYIALDGMWNVKRSINHGKRHQKMD